MRHPLVPLARACRLAAAGGRLTRFVRLATSVAAWVLGRFADALAPASCAACDAALHRAAVFCPSCAGPVVLAAPCVLRTPLGRSIRVVAFAAYGGAVADALKRLKYERRPDLARPLGMLLRRAAREGRLAADLVVPVPLHRRRLAGRGYNQAGLLARAVARELSAAFSPRALVRMRDSPQQAHLDRASRLRGLEGMFRARAPPEVRGKAVLLVDDVVTTGATACACADALLAAGAASVAVLVVARAEPAEPLASGDDYCG